MTRFLDKPLAVAQLAVASLVCIAAPAAAQQRSPHIGYVYPAGGQRGTTFTVSVGGQFLDGCRGAVLSRTGVGAEVVDYCKPPNRGQFNRLRQKLREYARARIAREPVNGQQQSPAARRRRRARARGLGFDSLDPATFKSIAESVRLMNFDLDDCLLFMLESRSPKRQPNAQLAETVELRVRVAPDAALGAYELRLRCAQGLTNPIAFRVGALPEHRESEPNNRKADAAAARTLPATINGRVLPGDVDRFAFSAKKGQRIVISVRARALVPYLADAVPGWFQATLGVYDDKGERVAYDDDDRFSPDPVLAFRVPADGQYVLEVKDAIYRGREDFVYRITLGEIPWVTSVYPLGGRAGETTGCRVQGWNLPASTLRVDARGEHPGVIEVGVSKGKRASNTVPFALGTLRAKSEHEPNDSPQRAQEVAAPLVVNGRIGRPGDRDVFRVVGHAGDAIVAEIHARRLGSPLDSLLEVTDLSGQRIAINDDSVDKGAGLTTHHADSRVSFELPAGGACLLGVADAQHKGSLEHAYRLSIRAEKPDFALRVVPASINARAGQSVPITVHALRRDGFEGEIRLALAGAPRGFALSGARIPAGADHVRLTLGVPPIPSPEPTELHLAGRARIGAAQVEHEAVPAEDCMQAFLYRHLVPADKLLVAVQGRGRGSLALRERAPITIPKGGETWLHFAAPRRRAPGTLELGLSKPPAGISVARTKVDPSGSLSVLLRAAAGKEVKPGARGNLILEAFLVRTAGRRGAPQRRRRFSVGFLPAVSFVIGDARTRV